MKRRSVVPFVQPKTTIRGCMDHKKYCERCSSPAEFEVLTKYKSHIRVQKRCSVHVKEVFDK